MNKVHLMALLFVASLGAMISASNTWWFVGGILVFSVSCAWLIRRQLYLSKNWRNE